MNLSETREIVKRILPIGVIATIIVLITVLFWALITKPKPDEKFGQIPKPPIESILSEKVVFVHQAAENLILEPPPLLKVYEEKEGVNFNDLAEKLGFEGDVKRTKTDFIWETGKRSLVVNKVNKVFTYSDLSAIQGSLAQEEAERLATEELERVGLLSEDIELSTLDISTLYYDGEHAEFLDPEPTKTNIYAISFGAKVESFDLVNNLGAEEIFTVWVGKDKKIKKLSGPARTLGYNNEGLYISKPFDEAVKELKQNTAVVINLSAPIGTEFKPVVSYRNVGIKYIFGGEKGFLQPVYIFEGTTPGVSGTVNVKTVLGALTEDSYR